MSCKEDEEKEKKRGSRIPYLGKDREANFRGKGKVCDETYIQGSNEYRAASSIFNPFPSSLIMVKRV